MVSGACEDVTRRREKSMTYKVQCECGATQKVEATLAGSRLACPCGREIEVPSLSRLKGQVGRSAMSAEIQIENMLIHGVLPHEKNCLLCKRPTSAVVHCWTTCERPQVKVERSWHDYVKCVITCDLTGLLHAAGRDDADEVHGRDLRFRLPLRVCNHCSDQLRNPRLLKETLLDVPIYSELLAKYPWADVSLDLGLAEIMRREDV